MKSEHYTAIITNARQGLPVSTANRRRVRPSAVCLVAALLIFWAGVAAIVAAIN